MPYRAFSFSREIFASVLASACLLSACGGSSSTPDPVAAATNSARPTGQALAAVPVDHVGSVEAPAPILTAIPSQDGDLTIQSGDPSERQYIRQRGRGTHIAKSPGCVPHEAPDFIDAGDPDLSRVVPRECRIVGTTQPVFSWFQPYDRDTSKPWLFTLRSASSSAESTFTTDTPRLLIKSPLAHGTYEWKVTYTSKAGSINSSQYRRFSVNASSADSAIPDGAAVAAAVVAKPHPRVLPAGSRFDEIAALASTGDYAPAYAQLFTFADTALGIAPAAEPPLLLKSSFSSDSEYVTYSQSVYSLALAERSRVEYLAYAWRFAGNTSHRDAALAHLVALAAWSPVGMTSESNQSQANRQVIAALSVGADLLWDQLTPTQQRLIASSLRDRIQPVMASLSKLDYAPYQSVIVTAAGYAVRALLLSTGMPGFPEATEWLKQAWEIYVTTLSTFGGEDGANGSIAYAWYDLYDLPGGLVAARIAANADLTSMPFVRNYGDFLIAMTAPNLQLRNAFGDGVENDNQYADYSFNAFRLYAALTRSPEHAWYWRQRPANYESRQLIDPWHFMLLGVHSTPVAPSAPTRQHWLFDDLGISAFHTAVDQSARSSLFFRSSAFGSHAHSHADQNSFVFVSRGRPMLVSGGYYPYYLSPHHATNGRATRYKNAVTFDGGIGQAEPVAAPTAPGAPVLSFATTGKLINNVESDTVSVVTGDATQAYRAYDPTSRKWNALVTNAVRSAAYFRTERVAVIYDWLTSETARTWELNYNAVSPFAQSSTTYSVNNDGASVCIDHYGIEADVSQTSGFDVAPESGRPAEYQLRLRAKSPSRSTAIVAVIREDCRAIPVDVTFSGQFASVTVNNGANVRFNQRSVAVLKR